jgi:adenine phosphoribosyltransferase
MTQQKMTHALVGKRVWEKELLSALSDNTKFSNIAEAIKQKCAPYRAEKVACFEALGFPLGAIVAHELKAGLVLVRKQKLDEVTSPDFITRTFCDYDGEEKTFKVLRESVPPGTKILIVDDLCDKGRQLEAASTLFADMGAVVVGAMFLSGVQDCVRTDVGIVRFTFPIKYLSNEEWQNITSIS